MAFSSVAIGIEARSIPECTEPTMKRASRRWISERSLRAPVAGLDSVSSVTSSTLRPAMPPPHLMISTAFVAHVSCHQSQEEHPHTGRESCRDSVCHLGDILVGDVLLKK